MEQMERSMNVSSFFMMDENFLLNRPRAMQLLERMKQAGKSWALYVFSSANAISKYSMEDLVQLGVSWIWLGLESPNSSYSKLRDTDTQELTTELRQHGIKLLGSTIVGLEHHTPENIAQEIEYAVTHGTDFHQFMLYTPVPGTPLFAQMEQEGRMLDGIDLADIHGQFKFNFEHAAISREDSKRLLDWAFRFDFERNGPSLFRICDTIFQGLEALQRLSGRACPAAYCQRDPQTPHYLQRRAVGHGEASEEDECRRLARKSTPCDARSRVSSAPRLAWYAR